MCRARRQTSPPRDGAGSLHMAGSPSSARAPSRGVARASKPSHTRWQPRPGASDAARTWWLCDVQGPPADQPAPRRGGKPSYGRQLPRLRGPRPGASHAPASPRMHAGSPVPGRRTRRGPLHKPTLCPKRHIRRGLVPDRLEFEHVKRPDQCALALRIDLHGFIVALQDHTQGQRSKPVVAEDLDGGAIHQDLQA